MKTDKNSILRMVSILLIVHMLLTLAFPIGVLAANMSFTTTLDDTIKGGKPTFSSIIATTDSAITVTSGSAIDIPESDVSITALFGDPVVLATEGIYTVSADSMTGGKLSFSSGVTSGSSVTATMGASVTVSVTPEAGNSLAAGSLKYTTDGGSTYTTINQTGGVFSFDMPANDVVVTASFDTAYTISTNTVTDYFQNDTASRYSVLSSVTTDVADNKAGAGQKVTLTITPAKTNTLGYEHSLRELTLVYDGEEPIKVDILKDVTNGRAGGNYTFTMPEKNVTVYAVFGPYTFTFPKSLEGGGFQTSNIVGDSAKLLGVTEDGMYETWGCLSGISVNLAVTAKDGYILKADTAKYTSEDGVEALVPVNDINNIAVVNKMPKTDIVFSADFISEKNKFNIDVGKIANGTVSVNKTEAMAGETIKLTVTPNKGYTLTNGSLKYTYAGGKLSRSIAVPTGSVFTNATPVTITMIMPQTNILVAAEFGPASIITFDPNIKHGSLIIPSGTLKLSDNSFMSTVGTQYNIQDKPDAGYMKKVGTLKYTTDGGHTYTPVPNGWTFTVPGTDVVITAEFVASGSVTAGTSEVDYDGKEKTVEVPITFATPSSESVQKLEIRLQYELGNAVKFKYIRIGETKLEAQSSVNGTILGADPVNGWVASVGIMNESSTYSFYNLDLTAGDLTKNPDVDFEENTQYTVYMGLTLNPNLVVDEIPIINNSRFNGIYATNTNGVIKINWTGATPPFTTKNGIRTYYLSKPEHLMWFAGEINNEHATTYAAILEANIDMTGYTDPNGERFEGIGTKEYPLTQMFNGNGKVVTYELTQDNGDEPVGFIRNTTAEVKSMTVNGTISVTGGSPDVGLAVGRTTGAVSGLLSEGTITVTGGMPNVGGVVGRTSANITGCTGKATINVSENAGGNIGGIVGLFNNTDTTTKTLNTSIHLGRVDVKMGGAEALVGGIVGSVISANGKVNIYSNGNGGVWNAASKESGGYVQGRSITGGIVGYMGAMSAAKVGNYQNTNFGTVCGGGTSALGSAIGGIFGIMGENSTAIGNTSYNGSKDSNNVYSYLNMNYGSISGNTLYVGGIVGEVRGVSTIIRSSYNGGEVTSSSTQPGAAVGGVVGRVAGGSGQVIEKNIAKGSVKATGGAARGGLIGYATNTMPQLDSLVEGKLNYFTQALGLVGCPGMPNTSGIVSKPAGVLGPLGYSPEYNGPGGDGSAQNPYQLDNFERLSWFVESVNSSSGLGQNYNAILTDDIDISDHPDFVGIGTYSKPYTGVFDGGGFTIKLALVNEGLDGSSTRDFAALFGYCKGATIKNLTTTGTVSGAKSAAGVVYSLVDGTIEKVRNEANVAAGRLAAGVLLSGNGVTLKDIVNTGDITSIEALLLTNEITNGSPPANCTGRASGVADSLGGSTTVDHCINEGNIAAAYQATGVIGSICSASASMTNCKNLGIVESFASLSLDSGAWLSSTHYQYRCTASGIVGWVAEGTFAISDCENSGTIKCSGNNVSGILGSIGIGNGYVTTDITVEDCKNTGTIISTYHGGSNLNKVNVGGIIGNASGSTGTGAPQSTGVTVTGSDNTGKITADDRANVSAIVGRSMWDDTGNVDYDLTDNRTNTFYGDDEEDGGIDLIGQEQPSNTEDSGHDGGTTPAVHTKDPGDGKETTSSTIDPGDGGGTPPSGNTVDLGDDGGTIPSGNMADPEDDGGPVSIQDQGLADTYTKSSAAEGTAIPQNLRDKPLQALSVEQKDLEKQPKKETLHVDEDIDKEANPEDQPKEPEQPNKNPLNVAADNIERAIEKSPFIALALGVAGAMALGGVVYELLKLLRRRRLR